MIMPTMTLSEAVTYVENGKDDGVVCPCCNQFVKRYRRPITSAMAYALILIHNSTRSWIHVTEFLTEKKITASRDVVLLRHWNLLEKNLEPKSDSNPDSGFYRITEKGVFFVQNKIVVPKYCYLFNNEREGFCDEVTNITDCLGDGFKYSELVRVSEREEQLSLF